MPTQGKDLKFRYGYGNTSSRGKGIVTIIYMKVKSLRHISLHIILLTTWATQSIECNDTNKSNSIGKPTRNSLVGQWPPSNTLYWYFKRPKLAKGKRINYQLSCIWVFRCCQFINSQYEAISQILYWSWFSCCDPHMIAMMSLIITLWIKEARKHL